MGVTLEEADNPKAAMEGGKVPRRTPSSFSRSAHCLHLSGSATYINLPRFDFCDFYFFWRRGRFVFMWGCRISSIGKATVVSMHVVLVISSFLRNVRVCL